jgi:arginase family enzyme
MEYSRWAAFKKAVRMAKNIQPYISSDVVILGASYCTATGRPRPQGAI